MELVFILYVLSRTYKMVVYAIPFRTQYVTICKDRIFCLYSGNAFLTLLPSLVMKLTEHFLHLWYSIPIAGHSCGPFCM